MAYINLPENLPGIRGLMAFRPETAQPLNEFAEILLRSDDNSLTRGERELMATYVSHLNDCFFCQNAHGGKPRAYYEAIKQAGSKAEWFDLPAAGIKGNTHMVMMDKNSDEVADVMQKWLASKGLVD